MQCGITGELDSRATEEPVKDIPVKQEDCGVAYSHYGSFSICEVSQVWFNFVRDMTLLRISIQEKLNTIFPLIIMFFFPLFQTGNCVSSGIIQQKMTPWACLKGPAQAWPFQFKGKQCFTGLLASLQQSPHAHPHPTLCGSATGQGCSSISDHLMALSAKRSHHNLLHPTPTPTHLSPLSSSLPTKWMTAFRNTRVRHDSEVRMLCHLCSTCFDASAAQEAEGWSCLQRHKWPINVAGWYCIKAEGLMTTLTTASALEIWNNYLWLFCHVINFQKTMHNNKGSIFSLLLGWCTLLFLSNECFIMWS